ncbi:Azu1 pseudoazurin (blue copper protein) [Oceaniovalibus guishaninsula JLT2003]|uniref:Pseudoazurin n=2 Tax=Oceaniovalibus TaxID=1207070 RepID=K2I739_9RHOB|nr:Azu1 pseudoazurin (blue copper protein) [Oceaniovalibus guishaninsula JLT2003]
MALTGTAALAETVEVKMLNKGEKGAMVFEPDFVRVQPGDTVKFVATDKGHNAESILDMIPDGADTFKGKINEEIEVTLDQPGLYGVKCLPHYAMGMVMTVAVGDDVTIPDDYMEGRMPAKAKERFAEQLEQLDSL